MRKRAENLCEGLTPMAQGVQSACRKENDMEKTAPRSDVAKALRLMLLRAHMTADQRARTEEALRCLEGRCSCPKGGRHG